MTKNRLRSLIKEALSDSDAMLTKPNVLNLRAASRDIEVIARDFAGQIKEFLIDDAAALDQEIDDELIKEFNKVFTVLKNQVATLAFDEVKRLRKIYNER